MKKIALLVAFMSACAAFSTAAAHDRTDIGLPVPIYAVPPPVYDYPPPVWNAPSIVYWQSFARPRRAEANGPLRRGWPGRRPR